MIEATRAAVVDIVRERRMTPVKLKAPFPYFGGKSRVAPLIWSRFGNVANYVEPFFGSGAVLLNRPHLPQTETVNDADCYLSNFWRALQAEPDAVAHWADWPVNECDLLARHKWLLAQDEFKNKLKTNPEFYDVKIAGWWVWGLCSWIGQGWCVNESNQLPHVGDAGQGINRKLPHVGDAGQGIEHYFSELSNRLRKVRVACGDWKRILGPSCTYRHGMTGVFLDPPYGEGAMEYSAGGNSTGTIAQNAGAWAIENGTNPLMRIAFCGYEGTVEFPVSWTAVAWKTPGGFGSQGNGEGRKNARRETVWFSPHCLNQGLFAESPAE